MHVGIDCRVLMSKSVGVRRYAKRLVEVFSSIDSANEYTLYYHYFLRHGVKPLVPAAANFRKRRNPVPNSIYGGVKHVLPPWSFTGQLDVFHAPAFFFEEYVPRGAPPVVITVHDVAYERFPEIQTPRFVDYYRRELGRAVDYADAIITISDSTARDVAELYPQAAGKTVTTHLAADETFFGADAAFFGADAAPAPFDFPYFLFVSTLEPRKNVSFLLEVYARAAAEGNLPHRLVLVGTPGWLSDPVFETAERLALGDRVVFAGSVAPGALPAYYKNATLFLFPSLYEGFGLPPLEAQAAGLPVVASDTSSLPEVLGDGAVLLPPDDADAWVDAIIGLAGDEGRRCELAERGRKNARRFSWEKTARETLAVYSSVAGSSS
jgi:glycosyltransferase involved in cell wall biosynthesis